MSDEEPPWWKWAGIPRLRMSAREISRREWRDIAWGVLLGSGILALALLLLAGVPSERSSREASTGGVRKARAPMTSSIHVTSVG
jgi:hypothetical protein